MRLATAALVGAGMLTSVFAAATSDANRVPLAPACTLQAVPVPTRPLPPELLRLAPQYFRPAYRGLFIDEVRGAASPAYYDPADPFTRSVPPAPLESVEYVTPHFLIGHGEGPSYDALVVNKLTRAVVAMRTKWLNIDDVLEAPDGTLWILGEPTGELTRHPGPLLLLRADNSLPPQTITRSSERWWWTGRLGVTKSGRLAVAWVEGGAGTRGRVSLHLAWAGATGRARPPSDVDAITLPVSYAELAVRTGANVVLQTDGEALAIAWRPFVPPSGAPADTGDANHPPTVQFPAEVRVVLASPGARPKLVSQYPTRAEPLTAVTGHGPWGLDPGGAWGVTLQGRATFFWLDPTTSPDVSLVAARLRDPKPTVLVSDSSHALWVPSAGGSDAAVVLNAYRSVPDFRKFEVRCVVAR